MTTTTTTPYSSRRRSAAPAPAPTNDDRTIRVVTTSSSVDDVVVMDNEDYNNGNSMTKKKTTNNTNTNNANMKLRKRHPTTTASTSSTTTQTTSTTTSTTTKKSSTRSRMINQMKQQNSRERQHKLVVAQCQRSVASIFSSRYLRIAGFFLSFALLFVGYYLWNIQSRRKQQHRRRQNQNESRNDDDLDMLLLPPVLRHVVMLYPHGISVRQKLPPFFGITNYAIATSDNLEARRTLQQFTKKRSFLTSTNNDGIINHTRRKDDRVNLYGWEKRDFEQQLQQFQWHNHEKKEQQNEEEQDDTDDEVEKESDTSSTANNNNMDGVCGTPGFAASYRQSKSLSLTNIQHDLVVWCLLSNGVHDGYVHWNIDNDHRVFDDNTTTIITTTDIDTTTTTGLLLLQPGYKGVVVQYYNQTRYDSSSIMLLPLSLKTQQQQHNVRSDTSRQSESESQESLDVGHLPRHILDWIVRGDVWRRKDANVNSEIQYKKALDELLYGQVQLLMNKEKDNKKNQNQGADSSKATAPSTQTNNNRWVVLQAVCKSQIITEAADEEEDDYHKYQLIVNDLDTKYRRVAVSGCTTSIKDETTDSTTTCDCILYHPHLKPPSSLLRRATTS